MSVYNLVQRGVVNVVLADGPSPKNFTLPTPVKMASSFLTHSVKSIRASTLVDDFIVTAGVANGAGPLDTVITPIAKDRTHLTATVSVDRTGTQRGAIVFLLSNNVVRLEWPGALAGSDEIKASVAVIESQPARGVNVRLTTPTNVEVSWDKGTLLVGESIDVAFEVFDIENLGDDIKEILFRQVRLLGYAGENSMQDLLAYDTQGNMLTFRVRTFDDKVNLDAATPGVTGALETGELSRVTFTQTILVGKNDRTLATEGLTDVAANPDIT